MEYSEKYMENLKRFKDCLNLKPIDRLLHMSNFYTWKLFDYDKDIRLSEALRSFSTVESAQIVFQERYGFDCYMDMGTRNLLAPTDALGSSHYDINDEAGSINFYDHVLMEGTEYHEYAADMNAFNWKMFHRKYPNVTKGPMVWGIIQQISCGEFAAHQVEYSVTEFNCPGIHNQNLTFIINSPIERFTKFYRGLRGVALDLRRNKTALREALDAIHYNEMLPALKSGLNQESAPYVTDTMTGLLAHGTMSQKQWDEFYWPYLKEYLDILLAAGKAITLTLPESIMRFAEYFQDYPKGFMLFHVEPDDIIALRKKLPNVCVAGGMPCDLLGSGTPQQCVDYVKYLYDELGDGFILSQDKMVSFRTDCTRENLTAVCSYVHEFNS